MLVLIFVRIVVIFVLVVDFGVVMSVVFGVVVYFIKVCEGVFSVYDWVE